MTRSAQHDTATSDAHDSLPRRRPPRTTRSPSLTRSSASTSSKRSPSPMITFTPTPLSTENAKGVKNITRKVIRRLEGLGHLEMVDMDVTYEESDESEQEEQGQVEKVLYELGQEAIRTQGKPSSNPSNGHSLQNGNGSVKASDKEVDYEIPRKLLHGSIGFFTLYLYVSEGDVRKIVIALWTALAVIVPADILRLRSQRFERLYERFLGFLMRDSEKDSVNGVVWYILGVNFALTFYPNDVATVAILILSWADTAASTFGRIYGRRTRKLPTRLPILGLPLAPRKSIAGFLAASITGACIAVGFWTFIAPMRSGGQGVTWTWNGGVDNFGGGGALGLAAISIVAGLVSGVAEALDLGSVDDNLTLPIISGGCILGFFKLVGYLASSSSSWFS